MSGSKLSGGVVAGGGCTQHCDDDCRSRQVIRRMERKLAVQEQRLRGLRDQERAWGRECGEWERGLARVCRIQRYMEYRAAR